MPADAGFQPSTVCNDWTYVLDAMAEYVNTVGQHVSDVLYYYTTLPNQMRRHHSIQDEHSPLKMEFRKSHRSKPPQCLGKNVPLVHPSSIPDASSPRAPRVNSSPANPGCTRGIFSSRGNDTLAVRCLCRRCRDGACISQDGTAWEGMLEVKVGFWTFGLSEYFLGFRKLVNFLFKVQIADSILPLWRCIADMFFSFFKSSE